MNRQAFLKLVDNPQLLGAETLDGLAAIVADYPFFQGARMLYVKNLSDVESIKYNSVLKTSAAFITNRDKLYHLVYSMANIPREDSVKEEVLPSAAVEDIKLEKEVESKDSDFHVGDDSTDKIVVNEIPISITPAHATDYFDVSDELDFSFVPKRPLIKISATPKDIVKAELPLEIPLQSYPTVDLLDFERENNSGYNLEKEHSLRDIDETNGLTFSDWLIKMRQQKVNAEVLKDPKSAKMDLINNFLKAKPKRIVPRMVDISSPLEPEKKVFEEPDNLLTETLANIYIKQKHYDKSITIFEKLRLKYPEKSVYFANRISEVEKLSNNNL